MTRIAGVLAAGVASLLITAGAAGPATATTHVVPKASQVIVEPPGAPCGHSRHPVLRPGDMGPDVGHLQCLLRRCGFDVPVDFTFGPQTGQAVIAFQRLSGLVVDGIVGMQTWEALHQCEPAAR